MWKGYTDICHGVSSDVCIPVWGNLKFWVSAVGCLFLSWIQSQNSIQACNYVCLDTSSLMHDVTSKNWMMYALAMTSIRQSYKRVHVLCKGISQLVVWFKAKHMYKLSWHLQCEAVSYGHNCRIYLCLSFPYYQQLPCSWRRTYRLI